jgi:streptogramin lyase
MAGLVSCNNINSLHKVSMNEVTTIGSAWALAPFMNGVNIGAPTTNQAGLANAFLDVTTLVNVGAGSSPGASIPSGTTVPTAEINTLANALVSCVNSVDNATTTSTSCANLFSYATPSGGSAPTDTLSSAINIARHPSNNVSQIIAAGGTIQAFLPVIASANDLSIAVLYSGNGITAPTALATDASGNIWVTNSTTNTVSELSHTGVPASGTPFTAGSMHTPSAIAIDTSGNAWIANSGNSTLTELSSSGANVSGSPFSGGGLSTPNSVAIDLSGNVWLSNSGNNSVSKFSSSGMAISGTSGYTATGVSAPVGLAIDPH